MGFHTRLISGPVGIVEEVLATGLRFFKSGTSGGVPVITADDGSGGNIIWSLLGWFQTAIRDKGGQVFNVKAYGATGDGTTDDTIAILAAIAAAEASTYRGILYFPAGTYTIDATTGTEILAITKSLRLVGAGMNNSVLNVAGTTPNTIDIIRYTPPAGGADSQGFGVHDLKIIGTGGRHGIVLDTAAASRFAREVLIERCWIQVLGGRAIDTLNTAGISTFRLNIERNWLSGGVRLLGAGDSVNVLNNTIAGPNVGIEAELVSGAALLQIVRNNITSTGGGVWIKRAIHPIIADNWMEKLDAWSGGSGNSALIDLDGSTATILHPEIRGNMLGILTGFTGDAVRANACTDAIIRGNSFNLVEAGSNGIKTTASALRTVEENNRIISGSGTLRAFTTSMQAEYAYLVTTNLTDSTAVGNTTTETNFDKAAVIPANSLQVGDVIEFQAGGIFSVDAAGTVANTLSMKLGNSILGQTTITLPAGANNSGWHLRGFIVVRAIGASGSVRSGGGFVGIANSGILAMTALGTAATTIATTAAITAQVSTVFAAARAGDTIKVTSIAVKVRRGGTVA